jgi:hypothetical protein
MSKAEKWAVAGVVAAIVGVIVAVIAIFVAHHDAQSTQASGNGVSQLEGSPNLGISFYQNGQLDPMSADDQGTVTVTMKSQPFELWFPTLASSESLEVCAATGNWVFADAAKTGERNVSTCLTPGMGVAAGPYGGGFLALTTPSSPVSTNISEDRARPAGQGYGKYYVSNLSSKLGQIYLVIYRYSVKGYSFVGPPFNPQHTEDFILNIS